MECAMHTGDTVQPIRWVSRSRQAAATEMRTVKCSSCHVKELCLPAGLAEADLQRLDDLMFNRRRVKEGQLLYLVGDRFEFLYAVRTGTFKSTVMFVDGREQVTDFHMNGEVMGLDGLATGRHASSATALEDADVCAVPFAQLSELAAAHPGMQQILARLMSREIVREHGLMAMLGTMSAEERVATFLLGLSRRLAARGYSPSEFHLRMSRADIGSYLGMKLETVSRTLSAFDQQGYLSVDKKHLRIIDFEGLHHTMETRFQ